jgi:hypothetical protein
LDLVVGAFYSLSTHSLFSTLTLFISKEPTSVSTSNWLFNVQHEDVYDPNFPSLSSCLELIKAWSTANPQHLPITIHLDLKDGVTFGKEDEFCNQLDSLLEEVIFQFFF